MHDLKESIDFRDGEIQSVHVERGSVVIRSYCAATETGELETRINMNTDGWIHLHFSHLGDKMVKPRQICANGVDINLVKHE